MANVSCGRRSRRSRSSAAPALAAAAAILTRLHSRVVRRRRRRGQPALVTVLVHDPMPRSVELPGIHGAGHPVHQLFLADDLTSSLQATYAIAHEESPGGTTVRRFRGGDHRAPGAAGGDPHAAPAAAGHVAETFDMVVALDRVTLPEAGKHRGASDGDLCAPDGAPGRAHRRRRSR